MKLIKGMKSEIVIEIHDIKILMIFKKFMKSMNSRNPWSHEIYEIKKIIISNNP